MGDGKRDFKVLADRYNQMLRLSSSPVAVKLVKNAEELESIRDEKGKPIRQIKGKNLALCQLLGQARYLGRVTAGTNDSAGFCTLGAGLLGFRELPEDYADGYVRAYFTDESIARKTIATSPRFEGGKHYAMVVAPLESTSFDPDAVIFFGKTAQIQRLIVAHLYDKGGRLEFSCNGEALCGDVIVAPIQTKKPVVGFPCNGSRLLSWPSDDEIACGIPGELLEDIIEGLEFSHRGSIRYPLTWVHLDWEPQGKIRDVMEGRGIFPPELRHPEK